MMKATWLTLVGSCSILIGACAETEPVSITGGGSRAGAGGVFDVREQAGAGGTAGSSSTEGAAGTPPTVPEECRVTNATPLPQAIVFSVANTSAVTYYLKGQCSPLVTIWTCANAYNDPLYTSRGCPNNTCGDPQSASIACGACDPEPVAITPGQTVTWQWEGLVYRSEPSGCTSHSNAPAGKYRVRVGAYSTRETAMAEGLDQPFWVDFDYPDADGLVELKL
ncbi:MAG TPA: hypothetical protein VKP30_14865 [Polyangiaceae bacterium]|nr:hypothetical protein [Polyangiaceae bacterium]